MALTLLRHLPPDVAKGTCYGVSDVALAPGWETLAEPLTKRFNSRSYIFTSPLKRCRQLAQKIGHFEVHQGLKEMNFGRWEMQLWAEIDRGELDLWAADFFHARPHGGESVAMLRDRVAKVLREVPDGALLVTHNGVIKAAAALTGHPEGWDISLPFGATLDVDKPVGDL